MLVVVRKKRFFDIKAWSWFFLSLKVFCLKLPWSALNSSKCHFMEENATHAQRNLILFNSKNQHFTARFGYASASVEAHCVTLQTCSQEWQWDTLCALLMSEVAGKTAWATTWNDNDRFQQIIIQQLPQAIRQIDTLNNNAAKVPFQSYISECNVLLASHQPMLCLKACHQIHWCLLAIVGHVRQNISTWISLVLFEMTEITLHISIRGLQFLSADTSSGTCRHLLFLCSNTGSSVCQVRHNCSTIQRSAEWINCGRQVTNLNGARIFRIIQQSDGAAVFPLKIPDAATHKSAQHLLRESLLCV